MPCRLTRNICWILRGRICLKQYMFIFCSSKKSKCPNTPTPEVMKQYILQWKRTAKKSCWSLFILKHVNAHCVENTRIFPPIKQKQWQYYIDIYRSYGLNKSIIQCNSDRKKSSEVTKLICLWNLCKMTTPPIWMQTMNLTHETQPSLMC